MPASVWLEKIREMVNEVLEGLLFRMDQEGVCPSMAAAASALTIALEIRTAQKVSQRARLISIETDAVRVVPEADFARLQTHTDDAEKLRLVCQGS
jgi:hypothetical protein